MKKWGLISVFACMLLLVAQVVLGSGVVSANGKPVNIVLTYLQGVSNWGPTNATGAAEVVMQEGIVRIDAVGLPSQSEGSYWVWLVNTGNSNVLSVGPFNTGVSGAASKELLLPMEIPDSGWNLLMVTVEGGSQLPAAPSERRSIAGYFPASATGNLPGVLPRTGGDAEPVGPAPTVAPLNLPASKADSGLRIYNGVAFGVVGLAAIVLGVATRAKRRSGKE